MNNIYNNVLGDNLLLLTKANKAKIMKTGLKLAKLEKYQKLKNLILLKKPLSVTEEADIEKILGPLYEQKYDEFDKALIKIPIKDFNEDMISIKELCISEKLKVSFSNETRIINNKKLKRFFYFRKGLAKHFIKLSQLASEQEYSIHVLDAYRTEAVQKASYIRTFRKLKIAFDGDSLKSLVSKANAKTAFAPWAAGHMSGAALDIFILKNGKPINMGNEFLPNGSICNMDYPLLTKEQFEARILFKSLVEKSGFTIYPAENWHISLGDITASFLSKMPVKYGPIKSFDSQSGKIIKYLKPSEVYKNFFDLKELEKITLDL